MSNFNKNKPEKIIYPEDVLFCCKNKDKEGYYLAHTTLDPECRTFGGMRWIAELAKFPSEKVRTGEEEPVGKPPNQKIRYFLHKDKLKQFITTNYGYKFSDQPSPWLPKTLTLDSEEEAQDPFNETPPTLPPVNKKKRPLEESDEESRMKPAQPSAPALRVDEKLYEKLDMISNCLLIINTNLSHAITLVQDHLQIPGPRAAAAADSPTTLSDSDVVPQ